MTSIRIRTAALLLAVGIAGTGIAQGMAATGKSLYDRMGGVHKIAAAMDLTVDRIMGDEMLMGNARMASAFQMIGPATMKFLLTGFAASHTGGPQKYAGPDMLAMKKWAGLSPGQMDRTLEIAMGAMDEAGVPGDATKEYFDWYKAAYKKAKPMAPMAEQIRDKASLYGRLGGLKSIAMVVNDFVDKLGTDPTIVANQNVAMALSSGRFSVAGLKYLVTEQLASAAGGPWTYSGRTMLASHTGLMISEKEWEVTAKLLKETLDAYKVPAKEQEAVFSVVAGTKRDIVGR